MTPKDLPEVEAASRPRRAGWLLIATLLIVGVLVVWTVQRRGSASPMDAALPDTGFAYRGHFVEDPAYQELALRLPGMIRDAARTAGEAMGLPTDGSQFMVRLIDDSSPFARTGSFVARTVQGASGSTVIELRLEPLLSGRVHSKGTLTHEVTHAVLAAAIGPGYDRLPVWLREGIAVHVAGETELCLSRAISRTSARPVIGILDGLSPAAHTTADYGEDASAIETFLSRAGDDGLPRLTSCLVEGGTWPQCLDSLTGLTNAAFQNRANLDYMEKIEAASADRPERYDHALALLDQGQEDQALEELDHLIAEGEGPFDREALYHSARALVALNRPGEAIERLRSLLAMGEYGPELAVDALALQVRASRLAGDGKRAEWICGDLLRFYGREGGSEVEECLGGDQARVAGNPG